MYGSSLLSRAKRVTLYFRSSFSMMYPQGPQLNTQGFPELFEGGGGGGGGVRFAGRSELLQDGKVFLKTNYAGWKLVMPNVSSSVYKSISVFYDHFLIFLKFSCTFVTSSSNWNRDYNATALRCLCASYRYR